MTVLGARFLGARSGFEAWEHRNPGFCVMEGDVKVAAAPFALVTSLGIGGGLLYLEDA